MCTKICADCKIEKPIEDFYSIPSRVMSYCKPCFNRRCGNRWIQRKIEAIQYKGGHCTRCNLSLLNSHYSVFDFHHVDPLAKDYDWNRLKLGSVESIHKELDKCVLLCSNCHRITHAEIKERLEGGSNSPRVA